MFHLGRDVARGKLQEIAASYLGTGDYVMLPKFRSKRPIIDQNKSKRLLDKLQDVPTYKDLLTRLKMGQDVTASGYRGATRDSEDDEHDDTDVNDEDEEDQEPTKAPEEVIDAGLFAALRRFSVSPVNSPDCSMGEEPVTLEETELPVYENCQAGDIWEEIPATLAAESCLVVPNIFVTSPEGNEEHIESQQNTPDNETVVNGVVEDTEVTKKALEEPPKADLPTTKEGPIANYINEKPLVTKQVPEESPEAENIPADAMADVAGDATHSEPEVVNKAQLENTTTSQAHTNLEAAISPVVLTTSSSTQDRSNSPEAAKSIAEASTASLLPPSLASPMSGLMSPGMSAAMTRIPGSSVFVLPGRTVSFTVEPDKKHCGQVNVACLSLTLISSCSGVYLSFFCL